MWEIKTIVCTTICNLTIGKMNQIKLNIEIIALVAIIRNLCETHAVKLDTDPDRLFYLAQNLSIKDIALILKEGYKEDHFDKLSKEYLALCKDIQGLIETEEN